MTAHLLVLLLAPAGMLAVALAILNKKERAAQRRT